MEKQIENEVDIKSENMPQASIIYMRRTGQYGAENHCLMERFKTFLKENGLFKSDSVILGIAQDDVRSTAPEQCRYDVCLIVDRDFAFENEKIKKGTIPGGTYVALKIPHTKEAVEWSWKKGLMLLNKKGYRFDYKRPILERYDKNMVDNGFCELCVPIFNE